MTHLPPPNPTEANILAQLQRLREHGTLARSLCSGSLLQTLRPLIDAGIVADERSGAGRRLVVRDRAALAQFVRKEFPDVETSPGTSTRLVGVARFRDSKALPNDTSEIVTVRVWQDTTLCRDAQPVGAAPMTTAHGVFSFLLEHPSPYTLSGPCALVENPTVFAHFERLGLPVHLAIHGNGRVSQRIVDWLAAQPDPAFSLLHLPDYDPVGLTDFARLRQSLGNRVALHLPPDLHLRFTSFATRGLLDKPSSRALLARLREIETPEIQQVLALIHRHNAGLEQEALLLPLPGSP
jgi:hypothetical protein